MSNINDFEITNGWLTKYKGYDSDVVIPDTVTTIDSYAFADCETLISVVIPESVKTISWRAFENCTNLTIHATLGSCAEKYTKENNIQFVAE